MHGLISRCRKVYHHRAFNSLSFSSRHDESGVPWPQRRKVWQLFLVRGTWLKWNIVYHRNTEIRWEGGGGRRLSYGKYAITEVSSNSKDPVRRATSVPFSEPPSHCFHWCCRPRDCIEEECCESIFFFFEREEGGRTRGRGEREGGLEWALPFLT